MFDYKMTIKDLFEHSAMLEFSDYLYYNHEHGYFIMDLLDSNAISVSDKINQKCKDRFGLEIEMSIKSRIANGKFLLMIKAVRLFDRKKELHLINSILLKISKTSKERFGFDTFFEYETGFLGQRVAGLCSIHSTELGFDLQDCNDYISLHFYEAWSKVTYIRNFYSYYSKGTQDNNYAGLVSRDSSKSLTLAQIVTNLEEWSMGQRSIQKVVTE